MNIRNYILVCFLFFSALNVSAIEFGPVEGADNDRWTLADWLSQKEHFSLMDSWLAMNSSEDLFWLVLSGAQGKYQISTDALDKEYDFSNYSASLWLSIFALEYFYEATDENTNIETSLLSLRFFGKSILGSQFVIFGGRRAWELEDELNPNEMFQPIAGGRIQLYALSFLGLQGEYRYYFQGRDKLARKIEGDRGAYGVFLQLHRLRLFGNVIHEGLDIEDTGVKTEEVRTGYEAGLALYF